MRSGGSGGGWLSPVMRKTRVYDTGSGGDKGTSPHKNR